MTYISPKASIEPGVFIGRNVTILGSSHIHAGAVIEDNCVIGKPSRVQMRRFQEQVQSSDHELAYTDYDAAVDTATVIGAGALLHTGTIIYSGCTLHQGVICEDNTLMRWDSEVGAYTKLMFGVFIGSWVKIGRHCRIGGFLCNDAVVGNYTTSFGDLTHGYTKYGGGRRDPAPRLEDKVTVGFNVNIIGGITIGRMSYVVADSMVTRDVPPETVVTGRNVHHPLNEWRGSLAEEYRSSFPPEANLLDLEE
jgi:UDP-3-O-[3-hydroxymyristoyl] glucosamine N-acyltransferase